MDEIRFSGDEEFWRLWDLYSPLLTDHQREITDLYFNYDLSLGEIAEEKGVSRQSVSDCLNKCRKQLAEYENRLGFLGTVKKVSEWLAVQRKKHPDLAAELDELEKVMDKE